MGSDRPSLLADMSDRASLRETAERGLDPLGEQLLVRDSGNRVRDLVAEHQMEPAGDDASSSVRFLSNYEFRKSFAEDWAAPDATGAETLALYEQSESVLGFVAPNGDLVLDRDRPGIYATTVHEQLHRQASPEFRALLGRSLDEGTTEYLTRQLAGEWYVDLPPMVTSYEGPTRTIRLAPTSVERSYPTETAEVSKLVATVGVDALAKAYFGGNFELMRQRYEEQNGAGAFDGLASGTAP